MSESQVPPAAPALQFDRAVRSESPAPAGVTCAGCGKPIVDSYFTMAGRPFCASCKAGIESQVAGAQTGKVFAKAVAFGLGAAIAGAIVYYGVIAITNLEIGIVAILIGYMVGYAIRKATRGFGARRYQILGAALTYFAVSMAYLPLAMKGSSATRTAGADSTQVASPDNGAAKPFASGDGPGAKRVRAGSFLVALGAVLLLALALPVIVIVGSLPSGLLSALIIGIGIRQAWRMTAAPNLSFTGPLKVAPSAAGTPGAPA
jgi:hypothetical protein